MLTQTITPKTVAILHQLRDLEDAQSSNIHIRCLLASYILELEGYFDENTNVTAVSAILDEQIAKHLQQYPLQPSTNLPELRRFEPEPLSQFIYEPENRTLTVHKIKND